MQMRNKALASANANKKEHFVIRIRITDCCDNTCESAKPTDTPHNAEHEKSKQEEVPVFHQMVCMTFSTLNPVKPWHTSVMTLVSWHERSSCQGRLLQRLHLNVPVSQFPHNSVKFWFIVFLNSEDVHFSVEKWNYKQTFCKAESINYLFYLRFLVLR